MINGLASTCLAVLSAPVDLQGRRAIHGQVSGIFFVQVSRAWQDHGRFGSSAWGCYKSMCQANIVVPIRIGCNGGFRFGWHRHAHKQGEHRQNCEKRLHFHIQIYGALSAKFRNMQKKIGAASGEDNSASQLNGIQSPAKKSTPCYTLGQWKSFIILAVHLID